MDKDGGGSVCEEEVRSLDSDDQAGLDLVDRLRWRVQSGGWEAKFKGDMRC
jgi:hypothetical protein